MPFCLQSGSVADTEQIEEPGLLFLAHELCNSAPEIQVDYHSRQLQSGEYFLEEDKGGEPSSVAVIVIL